MSKKRKKYTGDPLVNLERDFYESITDPQPKSVRQPNTLEVIVYLNSELMDARTRLDVLAERLVSLEEETERLRHCDLRREQRARDTEHHFSGIVRELGNLGRRITALERRRNTVAQRLNGQGRRIHRLERLHRLTEHYSEWPWEIDRHGPDDPDEAG